MGDFALRAISDREGLGAGRFDPPGGHIIVSRKEKLQEEYSEEIVTKRDRAGSP